MHRRFDLWGPDALEFDPDRFLDERLHKYIIPNPFIFLPFSAGPNLSRPIGNRINAVSDPSPFKKLRQKLTTPSRPVPLSSHIIRFLQNFSVVSLSEQAQPPESRAPKSWMSKGEKQAKEKIRPTVHLRMFLQCRLWMEIEAKSTDL